jgi:chromosome segregation ATPase
MSTHQVEGNPFDVIDGSPAGEDVVHPLPAFRSAKDFPVNPKPDRLAHLYPECLEALNQANAARHQLQGRMSQKKDVIVDIRTEIERLEQDLSVEAETRLRLHAMNEMLMGALRDIEQTADDITQTVEEAHLVPRIRLGGLIEKLKNQVKTWRAIKIGRQTALAKTASQGHHGKSDA